MGTPYDRPVRVERRAVDERESRAANGPDWDRYADEYQATHGELLGDVGFLWGPEGLTEDEAGDPRRGQWQGRARGRLGCRSVLTLGVRPRRTWCRSRPVDAPAPALSAHRRGDRGRGAVGARHRDGASVRRRVASTLSSARSVRCSSWPTSVTPSPRPLGCCAAEGRFAFSITHPTRWMFPDDPGRGGPDRSQSYWDRTPYVEIDDEHRRRWPTSSTTGPWATGWRCSPVTAFGHRPGRAGMARGSRPGLGRLVRDPRPAARRARRSSARTASQPPVSRWVERVSRTRRPPLLLGHALRRHRRRAGAGAAGAAEQAERRHPRSRRSGRR